MIRPLTVFLNINAGSNLSNLGSRRAPIAAQIRDACINVGFFYGGPALVPFLHLG